ncbi:MAG: hypothetical protein A3F12_04225 [Gammaproteobacteria bacterium RIFCSPHIGHO2_12_FULL_38_14]|nr:MAG: hypothetical protein A3F12_04225 [Gammaproteobacteria bacterium RIFCSPHIGHO2_12_FULL_38_14]
MSQTRTESTIPIIKGSTTDILLGLYKSLNGILLDDQNTALRKATALDTRLAIPGNFVLPEPQTLKNLVDQIGDNLKIDIKKLDSGKQKLAETLQSDKKHDLDTVQEKDLDPLNKSREALINQYNQLSEKFHAIPLLLKEVVAGKRNLNDARKEIEAYFNLVNNFGSGAEQYQKQKNQIEQKLVNLNEDITKAKLQNLNIASTGQAITPRLGGSSK